MVEASMVLPILILTILSLIMLLIFFYSSLTTQIGVHNKLIDQFEKEEVIFKIAKERDTTSSQMGGLAKILMSKDFKATYYEINEARIIRLGETIGDDK